MKGGQPTLFVSGPSDVDTKAGMVMVSIPTGDTAVCLAMTRHAALSLGISLQAEFKRTSRPPEGSVLVFAKTAKAAKGKRL